MKFKIVTTVSMCILLFNISLSQTSQFVNSLPILTEHTHRKFFTPFIYENPEEFEYPSPVISIWNNTEINSCSFVTVKISEFNNENICYGKYNLNSSVKTILIGNPDEPKQCFLLNVKYNGSEYIPISRLKVFSYASNGGVITFSFSSNVVKVYYIGDTNTILTKYSILSSGEFNLIASQEVSTSNMNVINAW